MKNNFDIIVLGGGHSGVEAAYCAAQSKLQVAILTLPNVGLASAPCNPSIGGIGKGQVVREIDAMGGIMGKLADYAGIQYRTLNESKGVAVQSTRIQIDKNSYSEYAEKIISGVENIQVIREMVVSIIFNKDSNCFELKTSENNIFTSKKLIVTTGTFLGGVLHCGSEINKGGRFGAPPSNALKELFSSNGVSFKTRRFKTGTPARISKKSIDFSKTEEQPSDNSVRNMHLWHDKYARISSQVSCYLSRTTPSTLKIIRDNKELSPMYNGQITSVGARYCPSIEDKAYRYPDKDTHHVFLEPEGLNLETIYPSGISTSLPRSIQEEFLRTIPGLEKAEIIIYGYAVEYDVVDTQQLNAMLEFKQLPGLYFAGQVNGTSGYEEAAAQGMVAGFNAALSCTSSPPLILNRIDSYIGLMIDDLVVHDRDEPYRLFTARSENRLFLREDNAFLRMFPYRSQLKIENQHDANLELLVSEYNIVKNWLKSLILNAEWRRCVFELELPFIDVLPADSLKDPKFDPRKLLKSYIKYYRLDINEDAINAAAIDVKYEGYISKAKEQLNKIMELDRKKVNLSQLLDSKNISFECKQRIKKSMPTTFAQLKAISGIRPATLAVVASDSL